MTTSKHTKEELQFLPAALEIQESPPSPIGRAITWAVIILVCTAVAWAYIGKIDIVAVAQGKIVPSERIKLIQPLEIGTISAIHVHEGQLVEKGTVLVELDTTSTKADATRLTQESLIAQVELVRVRALVKAMQASNSPQAIWPKEVDKELVKVQQQLLESQWQQYQASMNALDNERIKRLAELAGTEEAIKKLVATLPIISERADSLKALAEKKLTPRHTYLEIEQERIEVTQDLASQRQIKEQIIAAIEQLRQQRLVQEKESLNVALTELRDVNRRIQNLDQENIKAIQRNERQHLVAPVDGVVQQLSVHTVGGVVTPAQQLMVIVPKEEGVEVEAIIENKDIGFVHEGQIAEVKVDAFPFTKYGTLNAKLLNISNDAVHDERKGLIFTARVFLEQTSMQIDQKLIQLTPGMTVSVEVKTGTRRLIDYILSPLMKYADESVRER